MALRLCQIVRDPRDARGHQRLPLHPLRRGGRHCSANALRTIASPVVYAVIVMGSIWTFEALSEVAGDPLIALILMGVALVIVLPFCIRRDPFR